jgi:hypothetical protein
MTKTSRAAIRSLKNSFVGESSRGTLLVVDMTILLICGSRDATPAMLKMAWKAVRRASDLSWRVVVGDAAGVDTAVISACCHLCVPFMFCGISQYARNFCCDKHRHANYQSVYGTDYLGRDRFMVEESDRCFAIWNGISRGTLYTYNYARKLGKEIDLWQAS